MQGIQRILFNPRPPHDCALIEARAQVIETRERLQREREAKIRRAMRPVENLRNEQRRYPDGRYR